MSEEIIFNCMYDAKAIDSNGSIIKVIGVGGGGGNAVKHMYLEGIVGVDFLICNTDRQVLEANKVPKKMMLGESGLGAGAVPEVARQLAEASKDKIREFIGEETKMLFITAGMGKGTGTGAAPVVAQVAREMNILTIGVVTSPFRFEGSKRGKLAQDGIAELKKYVDSLIIVNNDRILSIYPDECVEDAFGYADDVLKNAVKCIAELITEEAQQNIDFNDIQTVMRNSGPAMLGIATASGPNRIKEVVEGALSCPLLDENMITNAKNFLFFISYGKEAPLKMSELNQITAEFERFKSGNSDVIWGRAQDEELGDKVKLSVIVTNYDTAQPVIETPLTPPEDVIRVEPRENPRVIPSYFSDLTNLLPSAGGSQTPAETDVPAGYETVVETPSTASSYGDPSPLRSKASGAEYDDPDFFNSKYETPAYDRQGLFQNREVNYHDTEPSLFEQSDLNSLYNNRSD